MGIVLLTILVSIPEMFMKTFFAMTIYQPSIRINKIRMAIFVTVAASSTHIFRAILPPFELFLLSTFLFSIIVLKYSLKMSWLNSFIITMIGYIVQAICEFTVIYIAQETANITLFDIQQSTKLKISLFYIYFIPLLMVTLYLRKSRRSEKIEKWFNSKYKWVTLFIFIQLIIGLTTHMLYYLELPPNFANLMRYPFFAVLMIVVTIIMLLYLRGIHNQEIAKNIELAEQPLIEEMDKLVKQWRSYKHDFYNHIEVLQMLINERKYDEAQEYMQSIYRHAVQSEESFPFKQPVIQALLNAKAVQAHDAGIHFSVKSDELFLFPNMKSYDAVIVLGNLIDNAIEALSCSSQQDKHINITYRRILNVFVLEISNNGPSIHERRIERIFDHGYTTKEAQGNQGIGLYTVKEIINRYGGELTVESTEENTLFEISMVVNT
ncbi:sensor histidine kinase [Bacillus solimangrovi]|uniref:histidine kinase n=1 Tax=Bacillus solimangrovi TaxID=1305675 RepID=A0A1E5LBC7_9BACI|nr:GHKL domain-containing protein [Bacillus solimangrovi]OEH91376.1 hypothetical protein BFG57_05790 [Bacillus solimangrovi]